MPVYNERAYLRRCVAKVLAAKLPEGVGRELIIVDDASTDGTREIIESLAAENGEVIRAFFQPYNQGKGAALRRAVEEIKGDWAIVQDADLEYDPEEYIHMLKPVMQGLADVVYGSRFAPREMSRVLNYHHYLGNKALTHLSNFFTGLNITDMETCYKLFKADVLKTIPLRSNRFGFEPEITAKIAKRNCTVYEIPISYYGRTYLEGKKIGWKDGMSALYTILKYWLVDDCFEERYGHYILDNLKLARHFNSWMVNTIEPFIGQRVLEIGSGIGNISRQLPKRELLTVTDLDSGYLSILKNAFGDNDIVKVAKLDLNDDADFEALEGDGYDTVLLINTLEHIEDERGALLRIKKVLAPGGKLVVLVPQHKWLYGSLDSMVGHVKRYERDELLALLRDTGYSTVHTQNFNMFSVPGWYLNAVLLRSSKMSKVQLKIFDSLVPLFSLVEKYLPVTGLSLISVATPEK